MLLLDPILLAQIGVGWLLIRYLIRRDRGPKEPAAGLWAAGLFGLLAVGLAFWLNNRFVPAGIIEDSASFTVGQIAVASLTIGLIEEAVKVLPLAVWLYRKRYFNEVTDGIIYFGIAGMVFGTAEHLLYSLTYGDAVGLMRLITVPFLHAGFCICFGWLLARRKVLRTPWWTVAGGLLAAILLHAAYDFGLIYGVPLTVIASLAITLGLNIAVFYLYGRAERRDRALGLSASSRDNWFCPYCGTPNPERRLRCQHCSRKT